MGRALNLSTWIATFEDVFQRKQEQLIADFCNGQSGREGRQKNKRRKNGRVKQIVLEERRVQQQNLFFDKDAREREPFPLTARLTWKRGNLSH